MVYFRAVMFAAIATFFLFAHSAVACPMLDGGTVGVWESVTPPGVSLDPAFKTEAGKNYGTNAFVLDPLNPGTVYLGTSAQGIWKSTDCGTSWVHVNTGANGEELDEGRNWTMVVDPTGVLYANAGYGPVGVWKSVNGGVDWAQVLTPSALASFIYGGFIEWIAIDPTNSQHLTVTPHFTCVAPHSQYCWLETLDGGATWGVIENAPSIGENSGQVMLNGSTWLWAQDYGGLWRTANSGASWTNVYTPYALRSIYKDALGNLYMPAAFNLIKSADGVSWSSLAHSHTGTVITGSATNFYVSHGGCPVASPPFKPFWTAPVANPATWVNMASPLMSYGAGWMDYDAVNGVAYASNCLGGFWRVVAP